MNKGFFIGKLIQKGDFRFILNKKKKHKSQIIGDIKLLDNTVIKFIGYDEMADYIYRKEFKYVYIYGNLIEINKLFYIEIKEIKEVMEFNKYLKIEKIYNIN